MIYAFGLVAFCLAWLLPGHYFPWRSFQQETVAAIGALFLSLGALVSPQLRRLPVPKIALGAVTLALVPLAQWWLGQVTYFADALLPGLYLSAFGLTIVGSAALARLDGARFIGGVFAATLVAAVASTGIGLVQWLRLGVQPLIENLGPTDRVFANFTQPNHLAALIGMAVPGVAWLFETRRVGRWPAWLALWFLGFGLVMTEARVGWLIVGVILVWWAIGRGRMAMRSTPWGVVAAVTPYIAMTLLWAPLNAALDQTAATVLAGRAQSIGGRSVIWPAMWDAAWREPLWGWGWMQVGAAQQAVALDHPAAFEWITYSHSLPLDLLVWNGVIVGSVIIAAIVGWTASRCFSCRDVTTWSLLAAGGAVAAHALVEFPHAYTYFLLPLAVLVGSIEAGRSIAPPHHDWSLSKWTFGAATAAMAAILAWIGVEYLEVEEAASRTRFKEAGYATPGDEPKVPDVILLDNQREFIWFRLTEAREGMLPQNVERMRRLNLRYMPPAAMLRYALAAGLNDRPDDARRNLRLICQMWRPRNCEEGRASWATLQERFPKLASIEYPAIVTPQETGARPLKR
jgi:Virulence factor membrane-bound polymerase, C-terminal/O-Antigen ligase